MCKWFWWQCNLSERMKKSKPGSNGSKNNAILVFLFLTSSFFHLLIKQKPDVRVKIIPLKNFFFLGSYVRHIQYATPYHEISVCNQSHSFTIELINKFESLCTSHLNSQSVFLAVSKLMNRNSNSYYWLLLLLSGDISLNPGLFHNLQPLDQNGISLNIEDYIFFTSISIVCCQKLMNLGT